MNRGDLAVAVLPGTYGKARPVLIIQSDLYTETESVTVLPLTSDTRKDLLFRVPIVPSPENGLREASDIMVDKAHTLPREKIGYVFGRIAEREQLSVNRSLAIFLGFSAA